MDPSPRVLHVEQSAEIRARAAIALREVFPNASIIGAERGADGLGRLVTGSLDCVVVGDRLPDTTAIDVLESVRELNPELPVFLLTTDGDEHLASAAIDADVSGYIPVDSETPYETLADRAADAIPDYRATHDRRRTKRRTRKVYERITDAFVALDRDWRFTRVNSRAEELFNRNSDALQGKRLWDALPDLAGTTFEDAVRRAMDDQESVTFEERYDPLDLWLEVRAYPDPTGLSVFVRDVSEWKAHEHEHRFFERVFESVGSGVLAYTENGTIQYVNPTYADLVDRERQDVRGCDRWDLTPDRDAAAFAADWEDLETGDTHHREGTVEANGERVPVKVTTTRIDVRDTTYHVDTVTDVTEQKRRERELTRQNHRLDEFASIVSHDIRNPLSIARGRVELAMAESNTEHLEAAASALDRMDALVRDLLELTRTGETVTDVESVSLERVAREAWRRVDAPADALTVDPGVTVLADDGHLEQLFENLFRNSIEHGSTATEAVEDGGTTAEHGDAGLSVRVMATDGGFAVADNGRGIPPDDREQVFEPGYTTADDGTGFGLVIVERIADAHGWDVSIGESEPGGVRFEFTGVKRAT